MELTQAQIDKFKEIHESCGGLEGYTDEQIREIATGVANFYLTLFQIQQRKNRESQNKKGCQKNNIVRTGVG